MLKEKPRWFSFTIMLLVSLFTFKLITCFVLTQRWANVTIWLLSFSPWNGLLVLEETQRWFNVNIRSLVSPFLFERLTCVGGVTEMIYCWEYKGTEVGWTGYLLTWSKDNQNLSILDLARSLLPSALKYRHRKIHRLGCEINYWSKPQYLEYLKKKV